MGKVHVILVHVCVCCVSMSCRLDGDEFPQQEEPSLLRLYKAACNRLSAGTAFKSASTSVSDSKMDDSGTTTPPLTRADALVTPRTLMSHQSVFIWGSNLLMERPQL